MARILAIRVGVSRMMQKHRRRLRDSGAPAMQTWNSVCGADGNPGSRKLEGTFRGATQAPD